MPIQWTKDVDTALNQARNENKPVPFGTVWVECGDGRRPLGTKTLECRWLLLDVNLHWEEILSNEAFDARIGIHLGIQPSACASHRRRVEVQK